MRFQREGEPIAMADFEENAHIDDILKVMRDQLSGALAPFFAVLPAHWFRPVVHLAISDVNKRTLVKSARLIPLLLGGYRRVVLYRRCECWRSSKITALAKIFGPRCAVS